MFPADPRCFLLQLGKCSVYGRKKYIVMSLVLNEAEIEKIVSKSVKCEYVLTPVPDALKIEWEGDGANYYVDGIEDGGSLIWVEVFQDVCMRMLSSGDWVVDDPGTLYDQEWEDEDVDSSPYFLDDMQGVAVAALEVYREVFERMVKLGFSVS